MTVTVTVLGNAVAPLQEPIEPTERSGADHGTGLSAENAVVLEIATGIWRGIGTFTDPGSEIEVGLVCDLIGTDTKEAVLETDISLNVENAADLSVEKTESDAIEVVRVPAPNAEMIVETGPAHLSPAPRESGRGYLEVGPGLGQLLPANPNSQMPKLGSREKSRNANRRLRLTWQRNAKHAKRVYPFQDLMTSGVRESDRPKSRDPALLKKLIGIGLVIVTGNAIGATSIGNETGNGIETTVGIETGTGTEMIGENAGAVGVGPAAAGGIATEAVKETRARIANAIALEIDTAERGHEIGIVIGTEREIVTARPIATKTATGTGIEIREPAVIEVPSRDEIGTGTGVDGIEASNPEETAETGAAVVEEAEALVNYGSDNPSFTRYHYRSHHLIPQARLKRLIASR